MYINKKLKTAFTLVELLVVIAIVGILSGLIIIGMSSSINSARIAKAQIFSSSLRDSLLSNLISEWKFEGPTAIDSLAGTSDAVDTWGSNNATSLNQVIVKGGSDCVYGKCLSFNNTNNSSIDCGAFQYLPMFTLSAWIKANVNITDDFRTIINKTVSTTNRNYWLALETGTAVTSIRFSVSGVANVITGTTALNDNKWHLVTAAYNNSSVKIYVDGALDMTPVSISGAADNSAANLYIGYQPSGSTRGFNGLIDEVRIFNSGIPTSQIREIYYSGLNRLLSKNLITFESYQNNLN